MKFDHLVHENVNPDGTFDDPKKGAVITDGDLFIDQVGLMICTIFPLNEKKEVHVSRAIFESRKEMDAYFKRNHLYYK